MITGRACLIAAATSIVLFGLVPGANATTRKWYWTESHASAAVVSKLRIPYCRAYPDDAVLCQPNGKPLPGKHPIGFVIGAADCRGADEYKTSFRFARFLCTVQARYASSVVADMAIYPTGATTFRWKIVS